MGTDSDGEQMTASGGRRLRDGGTEQKGLMDMDHSVEMAGGEEGVKGLNGNGKKCAKD